MSLVLEDSNFDRTKSLRAEVIIDILDEDGREFLNDLHTELFLIHTSKILGFNSFQDLK